MTRTQLIIAIAVVVVVALVAFLIIRRMRYIRALKGRGWTFDSAPALETVLDHQAPPFGLGFVRKPDELVTGKTASGIAFRAFEYAYSEAGPKFDERLVSLALPFPLPDLFVSATTPRNGVSLPAVEVAPGLLVHAADPGYVRAALSGSVLGAIGTFGQATQRAAEHGGVDLSIDGDHLVAVGAPKDPAELADYVESLAAVVQAIGNANLQAYAIGAVAPHFGFYGRPDWVLVSSDDTLINKYGLTTSGFNHRTTNVVRSGNDGLPLEAFVHHWQTQRTETYTDSEGRAQTRTVTENHVENVFAIVLPFALPLLSVGGGWGGEKVRFESEEFNDAFTVRTDNPKFASDVIHPRAMEYLLAIRPPGFRIEGTLMRFFPGQHDTLLIGRCADAAHGFLARVPPFVWKDLQISPPAFRM